MKLTPEQLAEWKRLTNMASTAPWQWDPQSAYVTCYDEDYEDHEGPLARVYSCRREDNAFIAASREAMPILIEAAEELLRLDAHYRASERLRQSYMRDGVKLLVILHRYRGLLEEVHTDPADCPNYYDCCHCMAVKSAEALELLKLWIKYSSEVDVAGPNEWDDLIERTIAIIGERE
jgi:hypothetical protein